MLCECECAASLCVCVCVCVCVRVCISDLRCRVCFLLSFDGHMNDELQCAVSVGMRLAHVRHENFLC